MTQISLRGVVLYKTRIKLKEFRERKRSTDALHIRRFISAMQLHALFREQFLRAVL